MARALATRYETMDAGAAPDHSERPMVTNEQLSIMGGIPMLFNAALIGLLVLNIKVRFDRFDARLDALVKRFDETLDRAQ